MIQPSFRTALMAAVGSAVLLNPGFSAARGAAIALAAVTMLADPEHGLTSAANPLPKNCFARNRHARQQAGLDNGNESWQVRTSFDRWQPVEGCQARAPLLATVGLSMHSRLERRTYTASPPQKSFG